MLDLQRLELHCNEHMLISILPLVTHLREVTLHIKAILFAWVTVWASANFNPPNLNIVTLVSEVLVMVFLHCWAIWNSQVPAGHTAHLKLYSRSKLPLNISTAFPDFQLEFGHTATHLIFKAS